MPPSSVPSAFAEVATVQSSPSEMSRTTRTNGANRWVAPGVGAPAVSRARTSESDSVRRRFSLRPSRLPAVARELDAHRRKRKAQSDLVGRRRIDELDTMHATIERDVQTAVALRDAVL